MNYINTNTVLVIAQGVPQQYGKESTTKSVYKYKTINQYPDIQAGLTTNYEYQI